MWSNVRVPIWVTWFHYLSDHCSSLSLAHLSSCFHFQSVQGSYTASSLLFFPQMWYTNFLLQLGLPRRLSGKRICLPMQEMQVWPLGEEEALEKIMALTIAFLTGKFDGQRSLVSYIVHGVTKEPGMTYQLNNNIVSLNIGLTFTSRILNSPSRSRADLQHSLALQALSIPDFILSSPLPASVPTVHLTFDKGILASTSPKVKTWWNFLFLIFSPSVQLKYRAGALGWPWGLGWGWRWEGGSDEGHMYTHGWFMSLYGRTTTILQSN